MINWGIIGLGNMANRFASSLNDVKNTKLLGVASRSFLRLKRFGDKYNIEKKYRYRSYDEILNCNEINAIYISTLNNTHTEIILKAIEAKKNILCEKPIATNYDDTVKIFEKLNNSGVFFLEGIAYRSHEQTKFVVRCPCCPPNIVVNAKYFAVFTTSKTSEAFFSLVRYLFNRVLAIFDCDDRLSF